MSQILFLTKAPFLNFIFLIESPHDRKDKEALWGIIYKGTESLQEISTLYQPSITISWKKLISLYKLEKGDYKHLVHSAHPQASCPRLCAQGCHKVQAN